MKWQDSWELLSIPDEVFWPEVGRRRGQKGGKPKKRLVLLTDLTPTLRDEAGTREGVRSGEDWSDDSDKQPNGSNQTIKSLHGCRVLTFVVRF